MGAIVLAQEGGAVARRRLMGVAVALAIAAVLAGVLLPTPRTFSPFAILSTSSSRDLRWASWRLA